MFRHNMANFREVVNKGKGSGKLGYSWEIILLCSWWNKYSEHLGNISSNWKCWVVCATYHTRCHKKQQSVGCPYPLWHLIIIFSGNRETNYFYLTGWSYWHFKRMWKCKYDILLTISVLNIDNYKHQTDSK
jgi:hypothetical protein